MRTQPQAASSGNRRRTVLILVLLVSCIPWAAAQNSNSSPFSRYDVFGGYLAAAQSTYNGLETVGVGQVPTRFGTAYGAEASFVYNFNHFLGIKGDFSVQPHREDIPVGVCSQLPPCSPVILDGAINPRLFNFLGGPEFKLRNQSRITPYAHGLIGVAHATNSLNTYGSGPNISLNGGHGTGFAGALGGGADIRLSNRFSFRTGTDYNPVRVGLNAMGARTTVNNVRFWGGILLH